MSYHRTIVSLYHAIAVTVFIPPKRVNECRGNGVGVCESESECESNKPVLPNRC
jgi:hypothetical protein